MVGGGGFKCMFHCFFSVTPHLLPPPSLELISLSIHSDKVQFCIYFFIVHPIRPDVFLILCVPT